MTTAYEIERFQTRDWLLRLRFHWRIRADNGEIILGSNQGHSRRIDRETTIGHFFEKAVKDQSIGFATNDVAGSLLTVFE